MSRRLLFILSSIAVAAAGILILYGQTSRQLVKKKPKICRRIGGEDKISKLSDDLLVQILSLIPTKDAVATMILSKRWQFIWTMVPILKYEEIEENKNKNILGGLLGHLFDKSDRQARSIRRFLDRCLELHKAPILHELILELGPRCPVDADVGKWITYGVVRKVRELWLMLKLSVEPISLPKSLYRCDTLIYLALGNKILIDVPSPACLPSLKLLGLYSVVYKDEDSLVRLLSSCPILETLVVARRYQDNLTNVNITMPSLKFLFYGNTEPGESKEGVEGSLVIDSAGLKKIYILDYSLDYCSIENKPDFDKAVIHVHCYPDSKFMTSISSLKCLGLLLSFSTVKWCNTSKFLRLIECKIMLVSGLDWLGPIMLLLQNSPHLKFLFLEQEYINFKKVIPVSWIEPSSVPGCLSAHLEIFEWKGYRGRREEKEAVRYIFANSKCLKRAGISTKSTCRPKDRKKMIKELESMYRVSTSSQLLFSTQFNFFINPLDKEYFY